VRTIAGWIVALAVSAFLAGCITSTTTGPKKPETNVAEAAERYYQLGARYYRNGNFELAQERLERALEYDPKMAKARSTLALTFEALNNPRRAVEEYELAVRYAPKDFEVRNTYAVFLCRQRDFDAARKQFDVAVDLPDNDAPEVMLTNAGVCMVQKPDYPVAEGYRSWRSADTADGSQVPNRRVPGFASVSAALPFTKQAQCHGAVSRRTDRGKDERSRRTHAIYRTAVAGFSRLG
jgi:type IV pilus biogenesis/stability protein PilW